MIYRVFILRFNLRIFTSFILILTLFSCQDKLEIFEIQRLPVFSYSLDSLNKETTDDINFYQGKTTIYEYGDGNSEVYKRYLFEAKGKTTKGNDVIINIELDIMPDGDFIGIYNPVYKFNTGGIHSFSFLENLNKETSKSYSLDNSVTSNTYLRIKRQNTSEFLILGDFFAVLQNDKDPSDKIVLSEGIFNDIYYKLN